MGMIKDLAAERSRVLDEVFIIKPSVSRDLRGDIFTTYFKDSYSRFLPPGVELVHDKFATSRHNVLRGLHGDSKTWKLVTCVYGDIFQVVIDNRLESKTYLKWFSIVLNDKNKIQVLIPPGFVNGYYVLSESAVFHYKLAYSGEYNDVGKQVILKWSDPRIGIRWPAENPILQERDK